MWFAYNLIFDGAKVRRFEKNDVLKKKMQNIAFLFVKTLQL